MYTNTNSLQLICENSCLNSANFTCRVIFREFYLSPKIFYTGVISDFCHKFHICVFPVWFVVFLSFCIFVFLPSSSFCIFWGVGELYVRDGMGLLIIGHWSFKSTFRANKMKAQSFKSLELISFILLRYLAAF